MSKVWFQWATPNPEFQIAFIARGSNPPNQNNPEFEKLLRYCLRENHWSPFQMADLCLGFETSLVVATQVKRHWSMAICEPLDIQETSMRYMDPYEHEWGLQPIELRKQAKSNRQSSEDVLSGEALDAGNEIVQDVIEHIATARHKLLALGVAREQLRMLYLQATTTRFFLKGSCRSWIHYFDQRLDQHTQKEHREVALQAYSLFIQTFPTITSILKERYSL